MIIIQDTREQAPLDFSGRDGVTVEPGTLTTGDYSLKGLESRIALERKSLPDLIACLCGANRERFKRELERGRALDYFAVLVEANLHDVAGKNYRSSMSPIAAMQSVISMQVRYRVPFVWCGSSRAAGYYAWSIFDKYLTELRREHAVVASHVVAA